MLVTPTRVMTTISYTVDYLISMVSLHYALQVLDLRKQISATIEVYEHEYRIDAR